MTASLPATKPCPVCQGTTAPMPTGDGWAWLRCTQCRFATLAEVQPLASIRELQQGGAASYIARYEQKFAAKMFRCLRRAAALRLLNPRGGRFLDVGANVGVMVEAASRMGFDATGVEPAVEMVDWARRRFPNRRFLAGMLEEAELPPAAFDVVYTSEVIEHTLDVHDFAAGLARLVKPGGMVCVTTPHLREYARGGFAAMGAPDHRNYFDDENMALLLRRVGFRDVWFKPTFGKGIIALARKA